MRPRTSSPHFCRPLGTRRVHTAKRRSKNRRAPSPFSFMEKAKHSCSKKNKSQCSHQLSRFCGTNSQFSLKCLHPFQVHARGREEEVEGCFFTSDMSTHFSPTHRMKYVAQGFAESQTNPTETCKQKRVQQGLWREVRGTPSLAAPPGPPHPWCAAGREDLDPCRVDIGERQEASSEHQGLFCTEGGGPAQVQSVFFSSSSLGSGMAGMGGCPFRTSMCCSGASSSRSLPSMSLARS